MTNVQIPPKGSGRPAKYDFSKLKPGGDPLIIPIPFDKRETYQARANKIRGAASRWGRVNNAVIATRLINVDELKFLHVYRKGSHDEKS